MEILHVDKGGRPIYYTRMKRLLSLSLLLFACPVIAIQPQGLSKQVVACEARDCEGSEALRRLFEACHEPWPLSLNEIVNVTQKTWMRPKGLERWQIPEKYPEKRDTLLPLFKSLGFIDAVHATQKHYDYGIVHGATVQRSQSRIEWLVQQWERGVRFDSLVFLSGERALDKDLELSHIEKLWHAPEIWPTSETEMIAWLWRRMAIPDAMRKLPYTLINASASDTRAHTGDTVVEWMAKNPGAGTILAVSNQPFVSYQHMSLLRRLNCAFEVETIGEAASNNTLNAVYLDNLARLLFEINAWKVKHDNAT